MKWTNLVVAAATVGAVGCGDDTTTNTTMDMSANHDIATESLYNKYGGAAGVHTIVTNAAIALTADCVTAPYFAVLGTPGHDTQARLASCLELQFTVALGGPGTYPGKNANGDMCEDMKTIHNGLGITDAVFNEFITDVGGVLVAAGVSADDLSTIAGVFKNLKTDVEDGTPKVYHACDTDGGTSDM